MFNIIKKKRWFIALLSIITLVVLLSWLLLRFYADQAIKAFETFSNAALAKDINNALKYLDVTRINEECLFIYPELVPNAPVPKDYSTGYYTKNELKAAFQNIISNHPEVIAREIANRWGKPLKVKIKDISLKKVTLYVNIKRKENEIWAQMGLFSLSAPREIEVTLSKNNGIWKISSFGRSYALVLIAVLEAEAVEMKLLLQKGSIKR